MELGFWRIAAADPDRVALVEPDHSEHTAGDLLAACNQVVHGLRDLGLSHGDVVAVLLPNGAPYLEVLLAVQQAGWQLVPINYHLVGPEIAYIIGDSGAKAFIADATFGAEATRAAAAITLPS